MNSRDKGKRGELEFAHFLKDNHGIDARRGQQFSGGNESPDVVGVPGLHLEVKRVESLNIHAAVAQATKDAAGLPWAVAHRRNGGKWLVTVDAKHYFNLRTELLRLLPQNDGTERRGRPAASESPTDVARPRSLQ